MKPPPNLPISSPERADILDILRGIALLGICVANYPMFSLYIFQPLEVRAAMPTAVFDQILEYFHFIFIDGKFYSLFSLLFGIGFSIIYLRNKQDGKGGLWLFYRRLLVLVGIGFAHLLLLWEGDILLLYALIGMLLPLFRNVSDKKLLVLWVVLIFSPLLFDALKVISDNRWNISNAVFDIAMQISTFHGITEANFSTWHVDHTRYEDLLLYNQSGIFWRYQGLLDNNRIPKVLGMFLLGLYAGRKLIFRNLEENKALLEKVQRWGIGIGFPASIVFAWLSLDDKHLPDPMGLADTLFYALSVVPLSLAYTTTICLWYLKLKPVWKQNLKWFAAPGRMALTNYLMQTVFAIAIFYGIGFGLGAKTGLVYVVIIASLVFCFQIWFSSFWLNHFRYGPIEWLWRCLTYGKFLAIRKEKLESDGRPLQSGPNQKILVNQDH